MKPTMTMLRGALAALLAAAAADAAAQSEERIAVPLTDATRPATLDVSLFSGSVVVTAYDGSEIVVVARETPGGEEEQDAPRNDGLRRIPTTSLGLTATERDNAVSIEMDFTTRNFALEISVPRRTSVHAAMVNGGDLTVTGVTGEHELENVNGGISATDIAGALVASTTNGNVRVSFTELMAGKAMSFSSFNGDVDVTFPANLAATLHINSGRGDLLTDFDVEVQPQPAVVERGGEGGRYQVRLERETRAIVGGGGPDMHFKTFNGNVMIRKR
jgi:hypothetical protein